MATRSPEVMPATTMSLMLMRDEKESLPAPRRIEEDIVPPPPPAQTQTQTSKAVSYAQSQNTGNLSLYIL